MSHKLSITKEQAEKRLDQVLPALFPEHSRSYWQKQIKDKLVLVNGTSALVKTLLQEGDVIEIQERTETPLPIKHVPIPVIKETKDYLIIDKPAGVTTHKPNEGYPYQTVAETLAQQYPELREIGDDPLRPGIVHRLDKDVSGVMVIARTPQFFLHVKEQFLDRTVEKSYIALVYGVIAPEEVTLDFPLEKLAGKAVVRSKGHKGLEAITHIDVKERYNTYTLLDVQIKTGRMHQIRAHLFAYGYPIVGETHYVPKGFKRKNPLSRLFLHAHCLSFYDGDKEKQTFCIDLPESLTEFLQTLS